MASSFVKFYAFPEALVGGKHDFVNDQFNIVLSNTAPDATADAVLADITEIAESGGYVAGGFELPLTVVRVGAETFVEGTLTVLTAAGGPIGPFRYAILVNDTGLDGDLVGYWDYGAPITLLDTEALSVSFPTGNDVFKVV